MAEDKIIGLSLINKALPSGILEKVFKQLDNKGLNFAKLTCKHWKQLIDKMTKPNLILHQAILENLKSVQHLIKEGENIEAKNSDGQTALHYAVSKNKLPIVEFLLEKGAKIEQKDKNGYTSLFIAVSKGYKPIVEILIKHDADLMAKYGVQLNLHHCT